MRLRLTTWAGGAEGDTEVTNEILWHYDGSRRTRSRDTIVKRSYYGFDAKKYGVFDERRKGAEEREPK